MANFRTINTLFSDQAGELHSMVSHAQLLVNLDRILQSLLSEPLIDHLIVSNISHDTLFISVDSAVWLNKAKLQLPEIFDKFKQLSKNQTLKHTHIKVDPHLSYTQNQPSDPVSDRTQIQQSNPVSTRTLSQISQIANNLPNPKLKKALLDLVLTLSKQHLTDKKKAK